jgi:hypothetical protein
MIYRRVFTGTITANANTQNVTAIPGSPSVENIVDCGGALFGGINTFQLGGANVDSSAATQFSSALLKSGAPGAAGTLSISSYSISARTAAPYSVWAEYTKP